MAETRDEQLQRILETAGEIYAEAAEDVRDSAWMPQELAAQIAERVGCVNIPGADTDATEEFLNAWTQACEAVASAIRAFRPIKSAGTR